MALPRASWPWLVPRVSRDQRSTDKMGLPRVRLYNIIIINYENVYIFSIYYNRENVQKFGIYNIMVNKLGLLNLVEQNVATRAKCGVDFRGTAG